MSQQALPRNTLLFGDRGSYVIEDVIGRGGFGITYSASAVGDGLPDNVAIKEFFPKEMCSRTENPDAFDVIINSVEKIATINKLRDRFIKESRNIESCAHPSIVRVLDTIECNGTAYMVMELIEGRTLKQLLTDGNSTSGAATLSPQRARDIIENVAEALDYLHRKKITHLDVKPDNIMITNDGRRVVLIDFGLSRQFNDDGSSDSEVLAAVSKGYASPEQYFGITKFSPECDIYSLGATFYKLLTGLTPPEPLDLKANPHKLTFSPQIPDTYRKAVVAATAYDSQNRPNSAAEFMRIVDGKSTTNRIKHPDPEVDDNDTERKPRRRLGAKIVLSILLLAIAFVCGLLIDQTWSLTSHWHENIIELSNREHIMALGFTGGLSVVAAISRSYGFKLTTFIITFLLLVFLCVNSI